MMFNTAPWRHANLPGQIANNLHETEEMEHRLILTSGEIALSRLSFNAMCGRRKKAVNADFNLQRTKCILLKASKSVREGALNLNQRMSCRRFRGITEYSIIYLTRRPEVSTFNVKNFFILTFSLGSSTAAFHLLQIHLLCPMKYIIQRPILALQISNWETSLLFCHQSYPTFKSSCSGNTSFTTNFDHCQWNVNYYIALNLPPLCFASPHFLNALLIVL